MAWEGKLPGKADIPIRVEAAAYHGKPISFEIIFPWTTPWRQLNLQPGTQFRIFNYLAIVIVCALLLGSVLLALRNLRLGLGDRKGAFRLAVFTFTVGILAHWVLEAHHVATIQGEFDTFLAHAAVTTFFSGMVAIFYLALEPLVRARWPQLIISWNRLLTGSFRDPLVGRDLLIGGLLGVGVTITNRLRFLAPQILGRSPNQPILISPNDLLGFRAFLSHFLVLLLDNALLSALAIQFVLVLLFILARKTWLTAVGGWLLLTLILTFGSPAIDLPFAAAVSALILVSFVRFGVLASVSLFFFWGVTSQLPLTADFSVWYADSSAFALFVLAALAVYGCYISLGGQKVFKGGLLQE